MSVPEDRLVSATLGICVTTRQNTHHVVGLAQAAAKAGVSTDVFLTGEGVHLIGHRRFLEPLAAARVGDGRGPLQQRPRQRRPPRVPAGGARRSRPSSRRTQRHHPILSVPFTEVSKLMKTLHIFRSKPDEEVRELIRGMAVGTQGKELRLYENRGDYGHVLQEILAHDQIVSWW
jgi:hypothetical protein